MKSMKKVLALALALAMVVTAVPVTNAEAATGVAKTKTYYAGKTYTLKLSTPSSWKKVKTTWSEKSSAVSLSSKKTKSVKVKAIKAGTATVKAKVTYKKSTKKNAKTYTKTYSCKVTVKEPSLALDKDTVEVAIGTTEAVKATVKPSSATVTFASDNAEVATVDDKGTVTGVKAGEANITATAKVGTKTLTATSKVVVKKVILKDVAQTEVTKIAATVAGDTSALKAADFKVTNTATNATAVVKSVSVDKTDKSKVTIETFTEMKDAKEYSVVLDGVAKTFTATDGTVAKVGLTKTEVPAAAKTEVKATAADANGVILGYFDLTNADSSKGKVTTALTITKGYVEGTSVYLPAVGDTMTAKVTYHTGTFGTDGKETGIIEDTFTITAVDPSIVNYGFAVTIAKTAPTWEATSFKANTNIKVGVEDQNAFIRITNSDGKDVDNYNDYSVESADPTKLVLNKKNLAGKTDAVAIKGVSEGDTYILVKKDDKVVASLPVKVQGKSVATSVELNKTSITVMSGAGVDETIEAKIKDQYNEDMGISKAVVENLAKPEGATAPSISATINDKKATVTVKGTDFAAAVKYGTYTYKITMADDKDKKEIVRTFTVNYVKAAAVQAYQLSVKTDVDTTVKADTADTTGYDFNIKVVEMANGAAIADYATGTHKQAVEYIVKDKDGKTIAQMGGSTTITCAAINDSALSSDQLTVKPVSANGQSFKKELAVGTYYVTAKFKVEEMSNGAYTGKFKDVAVSGSFTVKDSQDTSVNVNVKKNDLTTPSTVVAALQDTDYIEITYDGVKQTITSTDIAKIDGTIAGNTAYVKSVDIYVELTGSATHNKVLITVPVNQSFTNVTSL